MASHSSTYSGLIKTITMYNHMYANKLYTVVTINTLKSLIDLQVVSFSYLTAVIQIAVITSKLKAAEPTIVPGPKSPD